MTNCILVLQVFYDYDLYNIQDKGTYNFFN